MAKDQTVLFHSTIFGPIHSRRLGVSLGINLSPDDGKTCTFDCIYCEAGFNSQGTGTTGLPTRQSVSEKLRAKLEAMHKAGEKLDVITFSGNGEPTIHPDFPEIIEDVTALRNEFFPEAKVSVLTNSTRIDNPRVAEALRRADNNILKLDSAIDATMRLIDAPVSEKFNTETVIGLLRQFSGSGIIQTMMLRGEHNGRKIDNTTEEEILALADAYREIKPREIMLYSIDRSTPGEHLCKVPADELKAIGQRIETLSGIPVQVNA